MASYAQLFSRIGSFYEAPRWLLSPKSATFFLEISPDFSDLSIPESTPESISESAPL